MNGVVHLYDGNRNFGEFLKRLRIQYGYRTQKQLAERSGVSQTTLSRIEAGTQKPQPETLRALAPHFPPYTFADLMNRAGYLDGADAASEGTSPAQAAHDDRFGDGSPRTLAAHHDEEDWTEEELAEIEQFKQFVRMKRNNRQQGD